MIKSILIFAYITIVLLVSGLARAEVSGPSGVRINVEQKETAKMATSNFCRLD